MPECLQLVLFLVRDFQEGIQLEMTGEGVIKLNCMLDNIEDLNIGGAKNELQLEGQISPLWIRRVQLFHHNFII
jgi:hypothetical protein